MKKKLLSLIVTLSMILASIPVFATGEAKNEIIMQASDYASLQAAIDAATAKPGNYEIVLSPGVNSEDVDIHQTEGVNITLKGDKENTVFMGTVHIYGHSRYNKAETLTFDSVLFKTEEGDRHYFIEQMALSKDTNRRYPHNITVRNCDFEAIDAAENDAVAVAMRSGYNITIEDTTASGFDTFFWCYSGVEDIIVKNVEIIGEKGIYLHSSDDVVVEDVTIEADGYGIAASASQKRNVKIESCDITAKYPIVVYDATSNYQLEINGTNNFVAENEVGTWCAISTEAYKPGDMIEPETQPEDSKVVVTVNDSTLDMSGVVGGYKAPATGSNSCAYTKEVDGYVRVWGEGGGNASQSYELKLYSGEELIATTTLNNVGGIINGDVYVTWNFFYPTSNDEYWTTVWEEGHPNSKDHPTHVDLIIDGTVVDTTEAKMSGADDLNPVVWEELGGVKKAVTGLAGTGTEEDPYLINNIDELNWFRDDVNGVHGERNQYSGEFVKLTADIDLDGINWLPIGNATGDHGSFRGIFDGDNHTIKNLYIRSQNGHLGFFARTGGYGEGITPTVKNIVFENVDVSTEVTNHWTTGHGDYIGSVIANAGGETYIDNVHVKGYVYVNGCAYVGGIVGHGYPNITNSSVKAEEGSYVHSGYWCAGGIIGYAGEGGTLIENCSVSGLDIWSAYGAAAAVSGLLQDGNSLKDISAENIKITSNSDYCMGYIAGNGEASSLMGITVNNVTATANGKAITSTDAIATIGNEAFFDLQSAFDAVEDGETIMLARDVSVSESLKINKEITFVLDGNGHKITQADEYKDTQNALLMLGDSGFADEDSKTRNYTIKNVTFDGIKDWSVIRSQGVSLTFDNSIVQNCNNTLGQALLRFDYTESNIVNSTFKDNTALIGITHNFNGNDSAAKLNISECVFENNTFNKIAGVYYVVGGGCNIEKSEFIKNTVNCNNNGAVIYLGFQENCAIKGCLFRENAVTDSAASTRVAGAIFFGYDADIENNVFENNSSSNANNDALGQDVCTSVYYGDIDISNNYWDGEKPQEGVDYFVQHTTSDVETRGECEINSYYESYTLDENGNVILSGFVDNWDGVTIKNIDQLKKFRDRVNAGETYKGKTVTLIADIDLASEEWTPIGNSTNKFQGTFDGGNHKISNLVISGSNSNVGLFGFTTNGEIKNLEVENAKVSGRLNVGVLAGTPYTSKYTNIKITGHVEVNGMAYVGGMGGKNAYADITDVVIDVDETSYVKANSVENGTAYRTYVGGVVGFMGEGGYTVSNVTSNIDVIGSTCDVGGIVGIAHYGNKFINVSSSGDVSVTDAKEEADAMEIGGIAGVWHNGGSDVTFENCTYTGRLSTNIPVEYANGGLIGKAYSENGNGEAIVEYEAYIGTTLYKTIAEAVGAAVDGDKVVIMKNGTYTLPRFKNNITITAQNGINAVFDNIGAFNLQGLDVTFENIIFDYYPNANYTGLQHSGNLIYNDCTINGQVFLYGESETFNNCTFNQNSKDAYNVWTYGAKLVAFNECIFNSTGKSVLVYNEGATATDLTVEGCTFNASEAVEGKAAIEIDTTLMPDGTDIIVNNSEAIGFANGSVSGNTLWNDKKDQKDLTVTVDEVLVWPAVAQVGEMKFGSLSAALLAANAGDTITLLDNIKTDEVIKIEKKVIIDGQNYTITGSANKVFEVYANVTIKNATIINTAAYGRCVDTRVGAIKVKLDTVALEANGVNSQPITIGGNDTKKVEFTVRRSTVDAGKSGYGIISFVPLTLIIGETDISGYGALYMKEGSSDSVVTLGKNAVLTGNNTYSEESNSFGTIVFETEGITLNINDGAKVIANAEGEQKQYAIAFKNGMNTVNIAGSVEAEARSIIAGFDYNEEALITVTNTEVRAALEAEKYIIDDDGIVLGEISIDINADENITVSTKLAEVGNIVVVASYKTEGLDSRLIDTEYIKLQGNLNDFDVVAYTGLDITGANQVKAFLIDDFVSITPLTESDYAEIK